MVVSQLFQAGIQMHLQHSNVLVSPPVSSYPPLKCLSNPGQEKYSGIPVHGLPVVDLYPSSVGAFRLRRSSPLDLSVVSCPTHVRDGIHGSTDYISASQQYKLIINLLVGQDCEMVKATHMGQEVGV
jgi:hypothetical protein